MSIPPNAGPNVALLLQRLDLIEKKVDWVAQRVTWLAYNTATPTGTEGNQSPAEVSIPEASLSEAAESFEALNDDAAAVPTDGSTVAMPTPSMSNPAPGSDAETPHEMLDGSSTQAVEDGTSHDEEAARPAPAQGRAVGRRRCSRTGEPATSTATPGAAGGVAWPDGKPPRDGSRESPRDA